MGKKIDSKIEGFFDKLFAKSKYKQAPIQHHIPVEYIKDSILKLKNEDEYRIIINIDAVNFFIKTTEEKNAIINQFGVFLDNAKVSMQLVSQSKTLNMKQTLSDLRDKFNKCDNPHTKEYIAIYGNLLNNLAEDSNVLTKDFYLVLKYSAKENESFLGVAKNFGYIANRVVKSIQGCGVRARVLNENEIYQLLYLFYNKDKSKFQSVSELNLHDYMSPALMLKKNEPNDYNFDFMNKNKPGGQINYQNQDNLIKPATDELDLGIVTLEDILSADDMEIHKDHLVINSRYVRTIFVSGILKEECFPEWLSDIYTYPANIDISLHITPILKKVALDQLTKQFNYQMANLQEQYNKGRTLDEREKNDAGELDELRKMISSNQDMYQLSFYLSISANSLEELNELTMNIEALFGNKQILTRRASLNQLSAFNSVLPVGKDDIKYFRNIPTEALSTFFPFTNSELSCTNGKPILYGANLLTGSLIIFDKFNPPDSSITNYNSIICGAAGSGKSFATKLEIMRRYIEGTKVIGIDPNSEYAGVVARCGGQYIRMGGGSLDKINIFEISYYEEEDGRIPNFLQDKLVNLHSIFRMMFAMANEPYTAQYFNTIERALRDVYAYKGITNDPASLFVGDKIKRGNLNLSNNVFKEPPTLSDFKYILLNRYGELGTRLVEDVLDIFIDGSYNIFNGLSTVDTSSNMLFFDIKDCSDELKPLMYLVLCDFIWEKMKRKPKKENAIFAVDEAWIMMKNEFTAKFLSEFARQCRKFNVGLACITQQAADFFNDPWGYGKTIYANTSMHVLMKQTKEDIGIISDTYKISDNIRMDLITSQSGYGYIFWGNTFTKIYFIASSEEFAVINTNPNLA